MEYEFTLSFKLAASEADTDTLIERLGAAGCGRCSGRHRAVGRIALNFTREASSAQDAIVSASGTSGRLFPTRGWSRPAPTSSAD